MFKRLSIILVGIFCTGLTIAQAAGTQQAVPLDAPKEQSVLASASQQALNTDSFNFVIANPNTIDPKKFIFEAKPGESVHDDVIVKNSADVPLKFNLYGADSTLSNQGTFALRTKNEPATGVGSWIKFDQEELNLNPGEYKKVGFTLAVPSDVAPGDYSGGVAAEKTKADTNNPNIIIAVRIGLRVDVKVTDSPKPIQKKYADLMANPYFQTYFIASILLFFGCLAALGCSYFNEKKPHSKKHRHEQ